MTKQIKIEESEIHYDLHGQGRAIMLVHGFGEDRTVWDNQVDFLKPDYQLIVPDLPGSGDSGMTGDMSMEALASVLLAILDAEEISSCIMIGHSMGGYITLAFAEKYQSRLEGFGLFHSSAFADNEEKIATRRKGIDFIRENGAHEFLKTSIPNLFSPSTREKAPSLVAALMEKARKFTAEALVAHYESMIARPDRQEVLKATSLPVLFVVGEYDQAIPMADMLKQSHLPAITHIHILHQSGHMGMLEEKDKANQALAGFCMPQIAATMSTS